jgi:hypothetical protein
MFQQCVNDWVWALAWDGVDLYLALWLYWTSFRLEGLIEATNHDFKGLILI